MSENMINKGGINSDNYRKRANILYDVLDSHPSIYIPKVSKMYRSRINVTW